MNGIRKLALKKSRVRRPPFQSYKPETCIKRLIVSSLVAGFIGPTLGAFLFYSGISHQKFGFIDEMTGKISPRKPAIADF